MAQVTASRMQLASRLKQSRSLADEWKARAELAVRRGNDDLARQALQRRKPAEDQCRVLEAQLAQQDEVLDKLKGNARLLEQKIDEAKQKKSLLKARAQSAKASQYVTNIVNSLETSSALAAFERMEEKVMSMEAEAEAAAQLGGLGLPAPESLEAKFRLLEASSGIEDELQSLKDSMTSPTKVKGVLKDAGRPLEEVLSLTSAQVERELDEIRSTVGNVNYRYTATERNGRD